MGFAKLDTQRERAEIGFQIFCAGKQMITSRFDTYQKIGRK